MNRVYNKTIHSMGTRISLVLPFCSQREGDSLLTAISEELDRIEKKISIYNPLSVFSFLNRNAAAGPVLVDDEIISLLGSCKEYAELLAGAFDPGMRMLNELYNGSLSETDSAGEDVIINSAGIKNVHVDREAGKVFFGNKYVKLDPGAFGKGYALKRIESVVRDNADCALISFGESSILAVGAHPNGDNWKIGIPDLTDPEKCAYTFGIKNESLSVSGNTLNNSIAGRSHIINPLTGRPADESKTAAVVHKDPFTAEAVSTAFMILDEDNCNNCITKFNNIKCAVISYENEKLKSIKEYNN